MSLQREHSPADTLNFGLLRKCLLFSATCVCVLIHVRYFATPWTIVCQVPLSMEFSRQGTGVDCYFLLWGFCYLVWGNLLQQLQDAHTDKNSSIWCEEQDRQWRLVGDASPKAVWTHHPLGDFTLNSQQQGWPENSVSLFLPLARRTG